MNNKAIIVLLVLAAIGVGAVLLMQQGDSEDTPAPAEAQGASGSDMKPVESDSPSGSGMKPVEEVETDVEPMPQGGYSSGGSGTR